MNISTLWRRLLSLVSAAEVSLVDDTKSTQRLQVAGRGSSADLFERSAIADDVLRVAEYGFQSVPPDGADAVVLWLGGSTGDGVVIATQHQTYRLTGLAAGEVALSDDKGQKVYLSASGIRVEGGSLPIALSTTADITISANRTTFTGQVFANGKRIDQLHYHPGGTLAGNTGTVA